MIAPELVVAWFGKKKGNEGKYAPRRVAPDNPRTCVQGLSLADLQRPAARLRTGRRRHRHREPTVREVTLSLGWFLQGPHTMRSGSAPSRRRPPFCEPLSSPVHDPNPTDDAPGGETESPREAARDEVWVASPGHDFSRIDLRSRRTGVTPPCLHNLGTRRGYPTLRPNFGPGQPP